MSTIRKRGNKYQVQVRRTGQSPLSKTFHIRKDAEAWARMIEVQADRQELPDDPKALERITLAQLVERYRDEVSIRKRGYEIEVIVLNAFLKHRMCSKRLSELSAIDFAAYRDERLKSIKPKSLKRQLCPLHNMFEVARDEWGLPIKENPLDKVRLKVPDHKRERRLRTGEWDRIIQSAKLCHNPFVLPIIQVAKETAMRRGEILGMRWDHLDKANCCLLIPHTKNGFSRTIPITKPVWSVLDNVERSIVDGSLVFPTTANAFRLAWERVKVRAEIEDFHFHDLRHEAISRFFERGLSVPEVALISGHKDARMLFRYTHPQRISVLNKLGKF